MRNYTILYHVWYETFYGLIIEIAELYQRIAFVLLFISLMCLMYLAAIYCHVCCWSISLDLLLLSMMFLFIFSFNVFSDFHFATINTLSFNLLRYNESPTWKKWCPHWRAVWCKSFHLRDCMFLLLHLLMFLQHMPRCCLEINLQMKKEV